MKKLYPLSGAAAFLAGIGGELWSLFLDRPSFISFDSHRMAAAKLVYSNSSSIQELGMSYRAFEDTLRSVVR